MKRYWFVKAWISFWWGFNPGTKVVLSDYDKVKVTYTICEEVYYRSSGKVGIMCRSDFSNIITIFPPSSLTIFKNK